MTNSSRKHPLINKVDRHIPATIMNRVLVIIVITETNHLTIEVIKGKEDLQQNMSLIVGPLKW